jgi:hypothetical protein
LGVVTGKDLAQCCRDWYPGWTRWPNWLFCELAIGACDLAEVLGSAVALNLMFHIPLLWAVVITGLDVLLLLALQRFGVRTKRRPPRPFEAPGRPFKNSTSSRVSWNMKSGGNRSGFLFTAWTRVRVSTP